MNLVLPKRYDFLGRFSQLVATNVLSSITVPLAGSIGVALLGHLPNIYYLTGAALGNILFQQVYGIFAFLRMATTGLTAQAVGRDDRQEVLLVGIRNGIIAIGIGMLLIMLQYPLREVGFTLLNATDEVRVAANAYFNIRIWGSPIVLINRNLTGWLLGQERQGKVLLLTIISSIASVLLNYLLIVRWEWASAGAALSMVLSNGLTFVLGIALLWREFSFQEIHAAAGAIWDWSAIKVTFSLNSNLFVRSIFSMGVFSIFASVGATMGTSIFAENSLLIQLFFVSLCFYEGIGLATEALAGNFKGQNALERLSPLLQIGLGITVLVSLVGSSIFLFFPEILLDLLTNHTELIAPAVTYIPWLAGFIFFAGIAILLDGYFAALAAGDIVRNATLLGFLLGFVPLAFWAWHEHNNYLLWLALIVNMTIRALVMLVQIAKTFSPKDDATTPDVINSAIT